MCYPTKILVIAWATGSGDILPVGGFDLEIKIKIAQRYIMIY